MPRDAGRSWTSCSGPLLATHRLEAVILAGRWQRKEIRPLLATVAHIRAAGTQVIVIGPGVEYDAVVPAMLARGMIKEEPAKLAALIDTDRLILDREMTRRIGRTGAHYVSVPAIVYPRARCVRFAPDGGPMHFDYGHLTLAAARWTVAHRQLRLPPVRQSRAGRRLY